MAITWLLLLLASIFLHEVGVFWLEEYNALLQTLLFHFDDELQLHNMLWFDLQHALHQQNPFLHTYHCLHATL